MLPNNTLSTTVQYSNFIGARNSITSNILDYETGGINVFDSSQGIQVQSWRGRLIGDDIILDVPDNINVTPHIAYSAAGITEFSFTFNQNMNPIVVFVQSGNSKMYWYDSSLGGYTITDYGNTVTNPRVALDDKRLEQTSNSDVIFAYIKEGSLYYRQQRDRFTIERLLRNNCSYLKKIGMGTNNRFLFQGTFT